MQGLRHDTLIKNVDSLTVNPGLLLQSHVLRSHFFQPARARPAMHGSHPDTLRRVLTACLCMQVPYFPPVQSVADFPASKCKDLLLKAAGMPGMDLDIKAVKTWNMSAQVAERFQVQLDFLISTMSPKSIASWTWCRTCNVQHMQAFLCLWC